ncbi:hypothetical protein D3C81_2001560 [compost metagenome]
MTNCPPWLLIAPRLLTLKVLALDKVPAVLISVPARTPSVPSLLNRPRLLSSVAPRSTSMLCWLSKDPLVLSSPVPVTLNPVLPENRPLLRLMI